MPFDHATLVARSIRRHLFVASLAILTLVGGVGGWAMATNLAGAVLARGQFVVDSHVKTIKHPTGGVVGEIRVDEGDRVEAGEVLMHLDATETRANLSIVNKRLDELTIRRARLVAERDGLETIAFPGDLLARRDEPEIAAALQSERDVFAARRELRAGKRQQLTERIAQYRNEIAGLDQQAAALDRAIAVIKDELTGLRELQDKELVTAQRINALAREAATLDAQKGEVVASRARAAGQVAETRLQILQIEQDLKQEVTTELRENQAQTGEAVERRISAREELRRIDIVAPQAGVVHQLAVHASGAVISPGDPIMEIVPVGDRLSVEARVSPRDIDAVKRDQKVALRLTALNMRTTPELTGTVSRIAADLTEDERTGAAYYPVRIILPRSEIERLNGVVLVPGMPAEAFIQTDAHSVMSYLVKPLSDQISRAFRER